MSQPELLYPWMGQVASHFECLSKPQACGLAAFSLGIGLCRRCQLPRVAEALYWLGKPATVERRLERWIANPHLDWQKACQALARWVLGSLVAGHPQIVLLVDETSLRDKLRVMAVSLAYRGRAIPLAWWCYRADHWPLGQRQLITTLLDWVAPGVPAGARVLVQADRGLGTDCELLRNIQDRGWHFLVRVQSQVKLRLERGESLAFGDLIRRPGQAWTGPVTAFKKAGGLACRAIACWSCGHAQPWLLLTNDPDAQAVWYGWRMWEELGFRDFKSYGWGWHKSRVWNPEHANRLWLAMALAYAWILSLGTQGKHLKEVRPQVVGTKEAHYSLFRVGLRVLSRLPVLLEKLFDVFELVLIPQVPT